MRVVISGQSGLDKFDFTEKLGEYIRTKEQNVTIYHIGKQMCKELSINEEKILNSKLKSLDLCRKLILSEYLKKLNEINPIILFLIHIMFLDGNMLFFLLLILNNIIILNQICLFLLSMMSIRFMQD
jgi:hypothetical protein